MKQRVYVETTVVSYLTARPSRDLVTAAHQQITHDWWDRRRIGFDLFASEVAVREARAGDTGAAQRRLTLLQDLPLLEVTQDVRDLAKKLLDCGAVPREAAEDAFHLALSAVHGMNYLLTWNCAHLANARMRFTVEEACRSLGYEPPIICTPEELMEESA